MSIVDEEVRVRLGGRACCELHEGELEGFLEVCHCRLKINIFSLRVSTLDTRMISGLS